MLKCYYHPDREAVAVCSVCKKPLCKECAHEYKGKIYCKDCLAKVKEEENASAKSMQKGEAHDKSATKIIIISIVIAIVIIGLILLSTAGLFFAPVPLR